MNDVTRKQIKEIRDAKRNKESSDIHFLLGWIERQEKEIAELRKAKNELAAKLSHRPC